MRLVNQAEKNIEKFNSYNSTHVDSDIVFAETLHRTYHELGEQHVVEADPLQRLQANVARLRELNGRLSFMVSEVSEVLKV